MCLLKTGDCLIQVHFNVFASFMIGKRKHACLIQVACLLEVATMTGFTVHNLKCLSIGTPKYNKFSICPKWKIHYFQVSQNLGRVQPHYNVLEYWDP